jgi:hypothetical protein
MIELLQLGLGVLASLLKSSNEEVVENLVLRHSPG